MSPVTVSAGAAPALCLTSLVKSYGARAVDELDLTVRAGELYALLGPNGAGKTTTLRMVVGLLAPDQGTIEVFGVDALRAPLEARRLVGWLPDEPLIYDRLTPLEYLEFVGGLWGVDAGRSFERARDLLERLDLWSARDQRCDGLSRGMRQKVALAGALLHEPRLLVLDEPLTGIDAGMARLVKDMLRARVAAGMSVLITSHILDVVERLADRIGIISRGRLVAEGTLADLRTQTGAGAASLEDVFFQLVGTA